MSYLIGDNLFVDVSKADYNAMSQRLVAYSKL